MSDHITHHRGRKTVAATLIAAAALVLTAACQHSASGAAESRSGAAAAAAGAPAANAPIVHAPIVHAADSGAARVTTVVAGRGAHAGTLSAAHAVTVRLLPSAGGRDKKIEPGRVLVVPRDEARHSRL
ncbi:hypothetical protein [Streptomyces angustmyceticus]|uniref:hypothetical protein n=1 Tax=Streptomyces angustmyceticus TaxID=285578 RepID=UPI003450B993